MNLEPVIQSEISQKEKNKFYILTYIWNLEKMVLMNLFAGKEWSHRCRECTSGHSGRRRELTNGESRINIYTLPGIKQRAGEKLLCNTGSPAWHFVMTYRGRIGRGEGRNKIYV